MAVAELACPTCGSDLRYIQEYDRHYCYDCDNYAPEGYGGGKGLTCPRCGGVLSFIREYNRYFCHRDDEYMPQEFGRDLISGAPSAPIATPAPQDAVASAGAESHDPAGEQPIPQNLDEFFPPTTPATPAEPAPTEPTATPHEPAEGSPTPEATEPTVSVPSPEVPPMPVALPPLIRSELWRAKKSVLIDLCRAYGLGTSGGREALRDRLLSKLDELDKGKDRAKAEAPAEPTADLLPRETAQPSPDVESSPAVEPSPDVESSPESQAIDPEVRVAAPPTPEEVKIIEAPRLPEDVSTKPKPMAASAVVPSPVTATSMEPAASVAPKAPELPELTGEAIVAPQVPVVVNPCPACGRELLYVKQYDRYYCMHCRTYPPPLVKVERSATPTALACPTCGRALSFIAQFNRHYCHYCHRYAPPAATAAPATREVRIEVPRGANPCPTCARELRYIGQYDRWYCDACGKYAPKRAKRPCPACAAELTWIPRYRRYYCYSCSRYAPPTFPPPAVARLATARPAASAQGATATRIVANRRQPNASNAIGIAAMGVVMYVMYAIFAVFPRELGVPPDLSLSAGMAFALQVIALLLLGVGTLWGLWVLNTRK